MHELERVVINHCSPVLLGCKPAALFTLSSKACLERLALLLPAQTALFTVRKTALSLLVLVYDNTLLADTLFANSSHNFLVSLGYPIDSALPAVLQHLQDQFSRPAFPHEVGLFLGYPLEDVLGFVEHKGQNYKFQGYWKVYGDVDKAKSRFRQYDFCRERYENWIKPS
jgi:hypothetical protein